MNKKQRVSRAVTMMIFLLSAVTLPNLAAKTTNRKQINIFGSVGIATAHLDDPLIDFGIEFQVVQGLYFRAIVNSHLGSRGNYHYNDYYYSYGSGYYPGYGPYLSDGAALHGLSAFGVYKVSVSKRIKLFAQAGFNYISYRRYDYRQDISGWQRMQKRGYGSAFGAGGEFYLAEKFGLMAGGLYTTLFDEEHPWHPDLPSPGKPSWVQLYVGFYYHLKG